MGTSTLPPSFTREKGRRKEGTFTLLGGQEGRRREASSGRKEEIKEEGAPPDTNPPQTTSPSCRVRYGTRHALPVCWHPAIFSRLPLFTQLYLPRVACRTFSRAMPAATARLSPSPTYIASCLYGALWRLSPLPATPFARRGTVNVDNLSTTSVRFYPFCYALPDAIPPPGATSPAVTAERGNTLPSATRFLQRGIACRAAAITGRSAAAAPWHKLRIPAISEGAAHRACTRYGAPTAFNGLCTLSRSATVPLCNHSPPRLPTHLLPYAPQHLLSLKHTCSSYL